MSHVAWEWWAAAGHVCHGRGPGGDRYAVGREGENRVRGALGRQGSR